MKIGIIGAGRVGSTLAKRWAALGHDVLLGAREPNSESAQGVLAEVGGGAKAGTYADAAAFGEAVLLSVPSGAVKAALASAGDLNGKIVMDATNWFGERPAGVTTSIAEAVAQWAPGAKVIKAFNMTGILNMANPDYNGVKADLFICGDNTAAKAAVTELASGIGFEVLDAGALSAAGLLESLAQLWVHMAYTEMKGPNIAWKMLRR
jgi:8-hydroxy-5-deazaflavin:NADPH oxidoreductase